jgi:hypothetical protein
MKILKIFAILFIVNNFYVSPGISGSVDVSGYTNKGVHVQGELDINSDGSVEGYLNTDKGKSIHVEGELETGGSVSIDSDNWGGGGYDLDID